jgi:hypothetical protein
MRERIKEMHNIQVQLGDKKSEDGGKVSRRMDLKVMPT